MTNTKPTPPPPPPSPPVMSISIYTHAHCPSFTYSPLEMLTHLSTAHAATSAATLAAIGPRGLDRQLIKQRLHSTAIAGTRTYPCEACQLLHSTSFEAQAHLEHAAAHAAEVAAARAHGGVAAIADMISVAWLEPVDEFARTNRVVNNVEPGLRNAKAQLADVTLTLEVSEFSVRENYPARATLVCMVPRATATVEMLAACVEDAWALQGGVRGKIAWARMVRAVGVTVGQVRLVTDRQVVMWVAAAGTREEGRMAG